MGGGQPGRKGGQLRLADLRGAGDARRLRSPFYAYRHREDSCNAITGGSFYDPRRERFPRAYAGDYHFANICRGFIRRVDPKTGKVAGFARGLATPADLKGGPGGDLYYLSRGTNSVERVRYAG